MGLPEVTTKMDLARYCHASLFSPSISTLNKAIKNGNLSTWPGIQDLNFNALIGTSLATELGHLDQERKNLRSTKTTDDNQSLKLLPTKEVFINCYINTNN